MRETTCRRLGFNPFLVDLAKLGVAIAVGMPISLLDPLQLEGHPFLLQFLAYCFPVEQWPCGVVLTGHFHQKLVEEFIITELFGKWSMQPSCLGAAKIFPFGAIGNLTNPSYCLVQ
jgi:hypothetical protein